MENKKLLKYLLKDLSELDEMFSEKGKNSFDEMEMEFIQNRVSGAKRLVQLFIDHTNDAPADIQPAPVINENPVEEKSLVAEEKTIAHSEMELPGNRWVEAEKTVSADEKTAEVNVGSNISETKSEVKMPGTILTEIPESVEAESVEEEVDAVLPKIETPDDDKRTTPVHQELEMEEEVPDLAHHKTLGDSFLKEKSVNDLIGDDFSKLEHKLSNRPILSIQAAIGINDRFQYIRELFEGSAESFSKTVADLDSMNDIKEAVNYLQTHFKWKKNETSLKFVNLIKRRFPNE